MDFVTITGIEKPEKNCCEHVVIKHLLV